MKKLGGKKGTVHPSPEIIKPEDHFLTLLPVAILSLVATLSQEDREVLAYLISNSSFSNDPKRFKKNKCLENHSPLFICDCFSCYMSYWVRWDMSPSRQVIHEIIDAFEDNIEIKKKEQKIITGKKERRKRSRKVKTVVDSRLFELGSSSTELVGGDSVENSGGGEEMVKGSVEKIVSFIGQRIFGVWG